MMTSGWGGTVAFRWQRELPHWVLLWAMLGLAAYAWDRAPDTIPIHWGLSGEPNRYAGKGQGLLALPVTAVVMYIVLLLAPRMSRATEAQLGRVYGWVRLGLLAMLAALYTAIVLSVLDVPIDVGRVGPALIGALLLGVGATMGRMRPNPIMGVRTPWTLASQAAWDASHRIGGRIFMAVGALMVLGGLTGLTWLFLASIVVLFGGILFLVPYGWWTWRSDPKRLPRGQTLLAQRTAPPASDRPAASTASPSRTARPAPARRRSSGRRSRGGR
jgi:uncharacterized membrane protein